MDFWIPIGVTVLITVVLIIVNEVQTAREIRRMRQGRDRR